MSRAWTSFTAPATPSDPPPDPRSDPHSSPLLPSKLRNCCGLWRNLYLVVGVGSGDPPAPLTWRSSKHSSLWPARVRLNTSKTATWQTTWSTWKWPRMLTQTPKSATWFLYQDALGHSQTSILATVPGCFWRPRDQLPGCNGFLAEVMNVPRIFSCQLSCSMSPPHVHEPRHTCPLLLVVVIGSR